MPIERTVTCSKKDKDGDITAICNPGNLWSPRMKRDAISDIESGAYSYHVHWAGGQKTQIKVVNGQNGKYLRTDRDSTSKNNLDDLPDC